MGVLSMGSQSTGKNMNTFGYNYQACLKLVSEEKNTFKLRLI
jgi:hypothetical protein